MEELMIQEIQLMLKAKLEVAKKKDTRASEKAKADIKFVYELLLRI